MSKTSPPILPGGTGSTPRRDGANSSRPTRPWPPASANNHKHPARTVVAPKCRKARSATTQAAPFPGDIGARVGRAATTRRRASRAEHAWVGSPPRWCAADLAEAVEAQLRPSPARARADEAHGRRPGRRPCLVSFPTATSPQGRAYTQARPASCRATRGNPGRRSAHEDRTRTAAGCTQMAASVGGPPALGGGSARQG